MYDNEIENSTENCTPNDMIEILMPITSIKRNISQIKNDNLCFDIEKETDEKRVASFEEINSFSKENKNEIINGIFIGKNLREEIEEFSKAFNFTNPENSLEFEEKYLNQKRYFNEEPKEIKTDSLIINKFKSLDEINDSKIQRSIVDYYLKAYIANFLNTFLFKESNKKLEFWLKQNNYKYKIYKCNYLKNIGNSIERTLSQFLSKTFKEIFINIDAKRKEGIGNQIKNGQLFEKIEEDFNNPRQLILLEDFKKLYESNMEDLLREYYESSEFESFSKKKLKNGKTIEDYDYIFSHAKKRKRPSLLSPYGFIEYAKAKPYCHNERRKKIKMNSIL